ncbi:MAG: hypothetical protein F6K26_29890 [Moorea sp. SIO2I5]|nr:hypothetical protein [Moorena sp. SIO2I5]
MSDWQGFPHVRLHQENGSVETVIIYVAMWRRKGDLAVLSAVIRSYAVA